MLSNALNFLIVNATVVVPLALLVALLVSERARAVGRLLLRVLSHVAIVLAIVALVYDGTRTIAGEGGLVLTSLAEHLSGLAPRQLEAAHRSITTRLHPLLWEFVLGRFLALPAWLGLFGLGLLLGYLGRRRQRMRIYVNT